MPYVIGDELPHLPAGERFRALLDSFRLRDDEQLMVKLSYRFEI